VDGKYKYVKCNFAFYCIAFPYAVICGFVQTEIRLNIQQTSADVNRFFWNRSKQWQIESNCWENVWFYHTAIKPFIISLKTDGIRIHMNTRRPADFFVFIIMNLWCTMYIKTSNFSFLAPIHFSCPLKMGESAGIQISSQKC
jgi:hypothetical protein